MAPHYEEGTYRAKITSQAFDDGQYGVQFILGIEPLINDPRPRSVYLSLTDENGQKAQYAHITIDVLRHLGFHGGAAKLARLDPAAADHHSLIDIECEAYCKHKRKEDGTVSERWYINTPRAGMEPTPPAKTTLRKLDSLFGKDLKESPPKIQETPPVVRHAAPEQPEADQEEATDDIPF